MPIAGALLEQRFTNAVIARLNIKARLLQALGLRIIAIIAVVIIIIMAMIVIMVHDS